MAKLLAPPIIPEQSPGESCEEIRLVWYISQFIFIDYIFDYFCQLYFYHRFSYFIFKYFESITPALFVLLTY